MSQFEALANQFLAQKQIAVAGVSRNPNETANAIYRAFRDKGYEVFAVNPNAEMAEGDPCFPICNPSLAAWMQQCWSLNQSIVSKSPRIV